MQPSSAQFRMQHGEHCGLPDSGILGKDVFHATFKQSGRVPLGQAHRD